MSKKGHPRFSLIQWNNEETVNNFAQLNNCRMHFCAVEMAAPVVFGAVEMAAPILFCAVMMAAPVVRVFVLLKKFSVLIFV